jgi:dihydroorotate dehydrogenase (fumarate)
MADLRTTYMGIPLKNPLVAGASSLTSNIDTIKKLESSGAAALVISSLFEETIQLQSYKMEAVEIPVIASLNCVAKETWVEWAAKLEETGVDGLELNFFAISADASEPSKQIEEHQIETLQAVIRKVSIPVSVKLSPFYTNPLNVVKRMDGIGVAGFVIFNRLWHPEIKIDTQTMEFPFHLSSSADLGLPMRYVGLLSGDVKGSLCASNGIHTGADAVQLILAGADAFQVVSTLYLNGIDQIQTILRDLDQWIDGKGYSSLSDFKGKLNYANSSEKWTFKRAQYIRHLLNSSTYIERSSSL